MNNSMAIEPRRASCRILALGSSVWALFGEDRCRPGIITGLGKIPKTSRVADGASRN